MWYDLGGAVLGVGRGNGGYIRKIFTFTLLGYPLHQWFSDWGRPGYSIFGMLISLSLVLTKFVFDFRYIAAVQKYGGLKMIWVVIWAKIWDIFPRLLKRGASRVECLWIFYERSLGPHCWCSIGGHLLGVGRWNEGYIKNLQLLAFWVPIAPTVLRVGGTHRP